MEFSILPHPLKNSLLLLSLASLLTVFSCRNNAESEYEENEYELTEQGIQEELEMMRDPRTGRVPTEKLLLAKYATEQSKEFARANRLQLLNWIERGPNADVAGPFSNSRPNSDITAGRLRGLMIDSTDPTKRTVWVGSVSGGLWKTTNITAAPPTWTLVNDFLANMNIADICQDPRVGSQNIMYLCTGEAWYNSAAGQGIGVFKSTDGGNTWSYLSSTSAYTYCTRILCDYQGNVYLGTRDGLFRSTNGGTSWTNITPSTAASPAIGDLEISTTGGPARLHMVTGNIYSDQSYRYTDIPATATTNSGWNSPVTPFPSYNNLAQIGVCGNTLYAAPTNNSNQVTTIYKSVDGGANWAATATSPASSIFGSQGWIHLTVGINPANPNECIVGGLDNARTLDGGNTWSKISVWVGTTGQYAHADQCDIQWWDGGNKLLLGTDGGVHYSTDKGTTLRDRNTGLRIKQFYSVAAHPTLQNYFLAGAQDNGSHQLNNAGLGSSTEVTGGDGAYVAIDQNESNVQFTSYVQNYYFRSTDNGTTWSSFNLNSNGRFINPWDYDNQNNIIYASNTNGTYLRWTNPQTATSVGNAAVSSVDFSSTLGSTPLISAVHISPYTNNRVFFGSTSGHIFYISNANGNSPTLNNITPAGNPNGVLNCIITGSNENNLLAIYTNYGINNIWRSTDKGVTWTQCDGNLPDMPVRWAIFHPDTDTKAIIATETGVWETELLAGANTNWVATPSMPNVRITMLKYRASDRRLIASTYGRGIWSTVIPALLSPSFSFNSTSIATTNCPAPQNMSITLGTVAQGGFNGNIILNASGNPGGTTVSFSSNPVTVGSSTNVILNNTNNLAPGSYSITITGTAAGVASQTIVLTYTINVLSTTISSHPSDVTVCYGNSALFSTTASGSGLTYQWQISPNNGLSWLNINGATTSSYLISSTTTASTGYRYRCAISSSCGSAIVYTRAALLTITALPSAAISPANTTICSGTLQQLVISPNQTSQTATYVNNVGVDINDPNLEGALSNINVASLPTGAVITGIRVSFNILHTYVGDIIVNLKAPNGQTLNLVNLLNNGTGSNSTDNFINTVIDSTFSTPLSGATAPRTGNFRADRAVTTYPTLMPTTTTNWRPLFNSNPNGTWSLGISDLFGEDTGTLTYWSLTISYSYLLAGTWTASPAAAGTMFRDAAGLIPYVSGTAEDTIYVRPTLNTTYSSSLTAAACASDPTNATVNVGIPPTALTNTPSSVTVCAGSPFTLTVSHNTIPTTNIPYSYQWQVSSNGGINWTNLSGETNNVYTAASTSTLQSGNLYRCIVNTGCGNYTTNYSSLSVSSSSTVIQQPVSRSVCQGANTTFSISVAGTGVTYQWQQSTNGGLTWSSISNATNSTYTVNGVTLAQSSNRYRCIVNTSCGAITSSSATLTVVNAITISEQPASATICSGTNNTFSIIASGGETYQWQSSTNNGTSWSNINNATNAAYEVTNAATTLSGTQYRCIISGTCGSLTSNAATLTVNASASIIQQPAATAICSGANATFGVTVNGGISYQWQSSSDNGFNWNNLNGATNTTYNLQSVSVTESGKMFRCIVGGSCGTITSTSATLTVNQTPSITQEPISQSVCAGSDATFTITTVGTAQTYQWQISTNGGTSWSSISNATTISYTVNGATSGMSGYRYRCLITNSSACGTATYLSAAATLNVVNTIAVIQHPNSITVCAGQNATFTTTISGSSSYQWQSSQNGGSTWSNINGATSSLLSITAGSSINGTRYRCTASSSCGNIQTNEALLVINDLPVITQQPTSQNICVGSSTSFSVTATGTNNNYQWQSSNNSGNTWTNITIGTSSVITIANGISGTRYRCLVSNECGTITSSEAELTTNTLLSITQQPISQSVCLENAVTFSVIAIGSNINYQWQLSANNGSTWSNINNATSNNYSIASANSSQDGLKYRCIINSSCGTLTSSISTLTVNPITSIIQQSSSQTICDGSNTTLSVVAGGVNLTYQWQISTNNGNNWSTINNATNSSLILTSVNTSISGNLYRCIVNGECGRITSNPIILNVAAITSITQQPQSITGCEGSGVQFEVQAVGDNLTYQWQNSTNGGGTWVNIGGATNSSYSITALVASQNNNRYRCIINGYCGSITSTTANLIVQSLTSISQQPISQTVCAGDGTIFSIAASGTSLVYQWQKLEVGSGNIWFDITGATDNSFAVSSTSSSESGTQYRCKVSGVCNMLISDAAILTVNSNTIITTHPVSQDICIGSTVTFTVNASGESLIYQWQSSTNGGITWSNISGATASAHSIPAYTVALSGRKFRCIVNGVCGNAVVSNSADLIVNPLTAITQQPVSSAVCAGSDAIFSIAGIGTNLTNQWQVSTNGGITWSNINGATSSLLNINSATVGMSGQLYRCIINSQCGGSKISSPATLTVNAPPSITASISNTDACVGSTATFSINATSTLPIGYQWQASTNNGVTWLDITGANSNTLTIPSVIIGMNGNRYRCLLSNSSCSTPVISNIGILSVRVIPSITLTAAPYTTLLPGQITTLSAALSPSTGGVITTGWTLNTIPITPSSLTLLNVDISKLGTYQVMVRETWPSGLFCSALSQQVTITTSPSSRLFIFPSPNNGNFTVSYYNSGSGSSSRNLVVFDNRGAVIFKKAFTIVGPYTLMPVDMSRAAKGLYHVSVIDAVGNKLIEGKVVIN